MVYLQNGDEKLILDETKNITLTARRDFPWSITGFTEQADFQLLAAMVTPTDPSVETLIRDADNEIASFAKKLVRNNIINGYFRIGTKL